MGDEHVRHLARCSGLQHLDLSRCARLTDAGLAELLRRLPQLSQLDISWCERLSDRTLDFISVWLRGELGASSSASGSGLRGSGSGGSARSPLRLSASASAPPLKSLKVFGCAGMRADTIDAFRLRHPRLDFRFVIAPRDWATLESF